MIRINSKLLISDFNSRVKSDGGFTLVEMLVYIAILGILIVVISSSLIWANNSNVKAKVLRETQEDASRAMEFMIQEIRAAKGIYTPTTGIYNPATHIFIPTTIAANQLSLETTRYLPQNEATTYIDFFLCGLQICFKKEPDPLAALTNPPVALTKENVEVSSLVFTEVVSGDVPSIQIDLSLHYKNPQNKPEYQAVVNLTSTASLRVY